MTRFGDPVLLILAGLLGASLAAFFLGAIPYPFGLIVLSALIVMRLLAHVDRHTPGDR